ncbi:hypothetical protein D3C80_1257940 [compost metagenome]
MQAEPLFGHRMAIFQTRVTDRTGMNPGKARQIIGDKLSVTAVLADVHQHMFAFAVRLKAQVFHHHEIFRVGFQHAGALWLAMQPGQVSHIHAFIP